MPPGIHWADWGDIDAQFGTTPLRRRLLDGLRRALESLRLAGCRTAYIDGSFVTSKQVPADYDACWDTAGVDPSLLDPVLLVFDPGRASQKAKYLGELFPVDAVADSYGSTFLDFFPINKSTGLAKGIVALDLGRLA